MNNIEDNKYNAKLLEDIESIKRALKYYIKRNTELENELEYYKNAYENRVDEFINRDRKEIKDKVEYKNNKLNELNKIIKNAQEEIRKINWEE